jgi:hypothetical protein
MEDMLIWKLRVYLKKGKLSAKLKAIIRRK